MKRIARTTWAGPNGEREYSDTHGGEEGAWKIMWNIYTGEEMSKKPSVKESPSGESVEYKGKSGEEARADAYERMIGDFGSASSPRMKAKLLDMGWVIIDDAAAGWNAPLVMSKNKDGILREEEAISQQLSKGTVILVFEGAGGGVEMSMNDVMNSKSFAQAVDSAVSRSLAPVDSSLWEAGRRFVNRLSGYDIGLWGCSRQLYHGDR